VRPLHYNAPMDRGEERPAEAGGEPKAADPEDSSMTRTYASVLLVQAVVLLALWALGSGFRVP
jgi:hypothetical protein